MLGAGFAHGISIHFDTGAMAFSEKKIPAPEFNESANNSTF